MENHEESYTVVVDDELNVTLNQAVLSVLQNVDQGIDVFFSCCPACGDPHNDMIRINVLDEAHLYFLCQASGLFFLKGNEDLVCRGMKRKGIAPGCKCLPDPVSAVNGVFPDLEVEMICKECIELDCRDPSLCQKRAVLLYDREQMGDIAVPGDDNGLSEQGSAFGAADIKCVAEPPEILK